MIGFLICHGLAVQRLISAYYHAETGEYQYKEGKYDADAIARGIFDDTELNATGWYHLQIEGQRGADSLAVARAVGYIEGALTGSLLKNHITNVYQHLCSKYINCENDKIPDKILTYFKDNLDWVQNTGLVDANMSDPYYFSAVSTFTQIKGMHEAYTKMYDANFKLEELWMYMSHASIYDIARAKGYALNKADAPLFTRRGTAVVGRTWDLDNVYVGQTAWRTYGESTRIAKRYRLRYNNSIGNIVDRRTLSSYPFMLHSDDEFCISDMGLAITSTSIITTNDYASSIMASAQGFPYWFRNIIATLSSHSTGEWFDNYKNLYSTGTGIEYLLVDIKKFKYKEGYQDEFVMVVDEIPGKTAMSADMTDRMTDKRFVGSYDVPFIQEIYKAAGYEKLAADDPSWYSYDNCARAKILQKKAQTLGGDDAVKSLIRLNDRDVFPEQEGTVTKAISGRFELNKDLTQAMCFGAFDAKFTSIPRMLHSEWAGQVGATHDKLPPLNLKNADACDNSYFIGVDEKMYNEWVDNYFDIELDIY